MFYWMIVMKKKIKEQFNSNQHKFDNISIYSEPIDISHTEYLCCWYVGVSGRETGKFSRPVSWLKSGTLSNKKRIQASSTHVPSIEHPGNLALKLKASCGHEVLLHKSLEVGWSSVSKECARINSRLQICWMLPLPLTEIDANWSPYLKMTVI